MYKHRSFLSVTVQRYYTILSRPRPQACSSLPKRKHPHHSGLSLGQLNHNIAASTSLKGFNLNKSTAKHNYPQRKLLSFIISCEVKHEKHWLNCHGKDFQSWHLTRTDSGNLPGNCNNWSLSTTTIPIMQFIDQQHFHTKNKQT